MRSQKTNSGGAFLQAGFEEHTALPFLF